MKKILSYLTPAVAIFLAGCAATPSGAELDQITSDIAKTSFVAMGQAKMDRLIPDDANRACSAADVAGRPIDKTMGEVIEAASLKTIKWPTDGKFLGDWKAGEAIAQSGSGMTWSDKEGSINGGNCYNCHQLDNKEISFGTLGPSLYGYGKTRGVTDPASASAKITVQYTWGMLWNAKAYNACSNMPRIGHKGILTEQQIKHVMALLLDPKSPVNQ